MTISGITSIRCTSKIQDVLGRLRALPGVKDAAMTDHVVMGGSLWVFTGFTLEDSAALLIGYPTNGARTPGFHRIF